MPGAPSPATRPTAECLRSPHRLACREGQEAGGQAEAGDTAAAAQGSVSSPGPGPLGQRKPRQEGQSCHQPGRPGNATPQQPSCPQSCSPVHLHLVPFLDCGSAAAPGHQPALPGSRLGQKTLPLPHVSRPCLGIGAQGHTCTLPTIQKVLLAAASDLIFLLETFEK